jgi:hypothetical protein
MYMLDSVCSDILISAKTQRSARSLLSAVVANQQQADCANPAVSGRTSPHPQEPAAAVKSHPRSKAPPSDHQTAHSDKDAVSQLTAGSGPETTEGSAIEIPQYGGISIVELRRSCIMLLTNIIARQR